MFNKIASTFISKILTAIASLATVVIISQYMGAEVKGQTSLIVFGITLILLISNIVGGAALVYLVPRHNLFQLVFVSNIWSMIICIPAWFVFSWLRIAPEPLIKHIILLSLLDSFVATNLSVLIAKQKLLLSNIVSLLLALISCLFLVYVVQDPEKRNIIQFVYSLYITKIICLALSVIPFVGDILKINFKGVSAVIHELFNRGLTNQAGHIMKFMSVRLCYFLISRINGDAPLGVFSNGVSLAEALLLVTNSFAMVQYSAIANSNDKTFAQELTLRLTRISTLLCIAGAIVLAVLPANFYVWLFGNEFAGVKTIIVILLPGIALYNIGLITGHYFSGIGKYQVNTWGNLAGLLVAVLMSLFYLNNYSIIVAGIISTATYFITSLIILVWFMKDSGYKIQHFTPQFSDFKWIKNNYLGKM